MLTSLPNVPGKAVSYRPSPVYNLSQSQIPPGGIRTTRFT
jgi:hypothetical protein